MFQTQYFVRTMERHKESPKVFCPEQPCTGLEQAREEAKRRVLQSDPPVMLLADACYRNRGEVRTKYRCWLDTHGEFHELVLV